MARTVLWPTNIMLLMAGLRAMTASKYPAKSVNVASFKPAKMPPLATFGSMEGSAGIALKPQLPATTVVTP